MEVAATQRQGEHRSTPTMGGGPMNFNSNFFTTDLMNHCEFLKRAICLKHDDEVLLIPLLDAIASQGEPVKKVVPFYNDHRSLRKNPVNITKMYSTMRGLHAHAHPFNVFEASQLDGEKTSIFLAAVATAVLQWAIFLILVRFNLKRYQNLSDDPVVWAVTICTTFFFIKQCMGEWKACAEFQNFYKVMGKTGWPLMRICNEANNKLLCVVVPIFNVYFMLLSEDPNEAIMNALALYFLLELDTMAMPDWDERRLLDELAINCHDYIMEPLTPTELLSVTREELKQSTSSWDGHFSDDDILYIKLKQNKGEICIYRQVTPAQFDTIVYRFNGDPAVVNAFFHCVRKFDCIQKFRDIHD